MKKDQPAGTRPTAKRVAAILAIVLLVLLYLSTLLAALFDATASGVLFRLSLIGTFTIPLLTWVYIWMYGKLAKKHTIADFELPGQEKGNAFEDLGEDIQPKEKAGD